MRQAEAGVSVEEADREILRAVLEHVLKNGTFPSAESFHRQHVSDVARLESLKSHGLLRNLNGWYYLSIKGLRACDSDEARQEIEACRQLLPRLQAVWRSERRTLFLFQLMGHVHSEGYLSDHKLAVSLGFLLGAKLIDAKVDKHSGLPDKDINLEPLLYIEDLDPGPEDVQSPFPLEELDEALVQSIELSGYRPFDAFQASLGNLTIIIGANATGKSSLFDFFRLLSFLVSNPIPPEIDPRCLGKMLFHAGGKERISFILKVGKQGRPPLRYEVEIQGPVGSAKVARERLWLEAASDGEVPYAFMDLRGGKGLVRDPSDPSKDRAAWTTAPNELALRRAIDPRLMTVSRLQSYIASWRFYSGFDIGPSAAVRRPTHVEGDPVLSEDGSNLSAVLHAMFLEHRDAWEELEMHLKSTVPGFLSLGVKPRGGRGMVMGVWQERGVKEELSLADLSDGTLRLLCWLTLALSPSIPRLVCIDEPELGLHPKVLPTLAGALRFASARSQILIATHSPYFLAQFKLDDIAVMRKDDGRAVFVRPGTSAALRREVDELGDEALARLHISEELEILP
jgi:predicted ATPase